MTIYLNLYLITYIINLMSIQFIIKTIFSNKIESISLQYIIHYILNFSNFKTILLCLILSLTGIPPFIFFFIKFNYLINLLSKINFIYLYFIVLLIFFNMIFYVQIFSIKNLNINNNYIKLKKKKINFKEISVIYYIVFFFIASIFFFLDIYLVSALYL